MTAIIPTDELTADVNYARQRFGGPFVNYLRRREENRDVRSTTPSEWTDRLREKWDTAPDGDKGRTEAEKYLADERDAATVWQEMLAADLDGHRGWYHDRYEDLVVGSEVVDVGCGLGISGLDFLRQGAAVTFVDIVPENLEFVRRVASDLDCADRAEFVLMDGPDDTDTLRTLPAEYDVVFAQGSLHHAPRHVVEPEIQALLDRLRVGGRWLQLAYPYSRWRYRGRPPFSEWGKWTDGEETPWTEPYDVAKLLDVMAPAELEVQFTKEWGDPGEWFGGCLEQFFRNRADAFIWFDLELQSPPD